MDHLGNVRASFQAHPTTGAVDVLQRDDYYAFGKQRQVSGGTNKYLYNGKELQEELNQYDYGARFYDPVIGRWNAVDNYSETYYGLTPYNYGGNSPVNTIDIDGNLFIFANGFMIDQYAGGQNATKSVPSGYDRRGYPTGWKSVPNSNYYNPNRGFYRDGPRNNGKKFETDYWEGVDNAYMAAYNDDNVLYTNGSFTPKATAGARFAEGSKAGEDLIKRLESGEISLQEGETIKIVGHSQGAAYAAGIASVLAKNSKYGSLLEFVDYLSPHQPGDIKHPQGVLGRQFSTKTDKVSSFGYVPLLFGGSEYEKISGTKWGKERESYKGGRGGHSVGTWLNDLVNYWRSLGIPVTVRE